MQAVPALQKCKQGICNISVLHTSASIAIGDKGLEDSVTVVEQDLDRLVPEVWGMGRAF